MGQVAVCALTEILGSTKRLNVNYQDSDGFSALHHAALSGTSELLALLLEAQSMVDIKDSNGMRPLHYAAWQGKKDSVKLLLRAGASVNAASHDGQIPLHLSAQYGHYEVSEMLLQHQSNPCTVNKAKKTPLDLACEFGRFKVTQLLLNSNMVGVLLEGEGKETTPLHLAARNGHKDIIRLLLRAGIYINSSTKSGTALHDAALYGKTEVVRLLLEAGIDVNIRNTCNHTALDVVNQFTTSHASRDIKQLLRDATAVLQVRALRDYWNLHDPTALNIRAGDVIMVLEQHIDGRWKGHIHDIRSDTDRVGYFPPSIVEIVSRRSDGTLSRQASLPTPRQHYLSQVPPLPVCSPSHAPQTDDAYVLYAPPIHSSIPPTRGPAEEHKGSTLISPPKDPGDIWVLRQSSDAGDRSSVGSVGSVGSTRSAGSGQSAECSYGHSSLPPPTTVHDCNKMSPSTGDPVEQYSSVQDPLPSHRQVLNTTRGKEQSPPPHHIYPEKFMEGRDTEAIYMWLREFQLENYTTNFLKAGYDIPTISRMTPEDLTAIGVTKPGHRKKISTEIANLSIPEWLPDYIPSDIGEWLSAIGLPQYQKTLAENGYDSVSIVQDVTWEDLQEIGINKLGHQKKLMLAVKKLCDVHKAQRTQMERQSTLQRQRPQPVLELVAIEPPENADCPPTSSPFISKMSTFQDSELSTELQKAISSGSYSTPCQSGLSLSQESIGTRSRGSGRSQDPFQASSTPPHSRSEESLGSTDTNSGKDYCLDPWEPAMAPSRPMVPQVQVMQPPVRSSQTLSSPVTPNRSSCFAYSAALSKPQSQFGSPHGSPTRRGFNYLQPQTGSSSAKAPNATTDPFKTRKRTQSLTRYALSDGEGEEEEEAPTVPSGALASYATLTRRPHRGQLSLNASTSQTVVTRSHNVGRSHSFAVRGRKKGPPPPPPKRMSSAPGGVSGSVTDGGCGGPGGGGVETVSMGSVKSIAALLESSTGSSVKSFNFSPTQGSNQTTVYSPTKSSNQSTNYSLTSNIKQMSNFSPTKTTNQTSNLSPPKTKNRMFSPTKTDKYSPTKKCIQTSNHSPSRTTNQPSNYSPTMTDNYSPNKISNETSNYSPPKTAKQSSNFGPKISNNSTMAVNQCSNLNSTKSSNKTCNFSPTKTHIINSVPVRTSNPSTTKHINNIHRSSTSAHPSLSDNLGFRLIQGEAWEGDDQQTGEGLVQYGMQVLQTSVPQNGLSESIPFAEDGNLTIKQRPKATGAKAQPKAEHKSSIPLAKTSNSSLELPEFNLKESDTVKRRHKPKEKNPQINGPGALTHTYDWTVRSTEDENLRAKPLKPLMSPKPDISPQTSPSNIFQHSGTPVRETSCPSRMFTVVQSLAFTTLSPDSPPASLIPQRLGRIEHSLSPRDEPDLLVQQRLEETSTSLEAALKVVERKLAKKDLTDSNMNMVKSAGNILDDIGNMFDDLADQLDAMLD
ncbi:caskin-2 isoform X2 [Denticeps clupeoides]|uniref:caskin-2 isoform X2 n=1 Tax=Denticeps clupeoides TaxID=299321 RepID=UPI0010A3965E|nr:caskin-2-like isoform X2 [Denticeps clupeoides]